MTKAKIVRTVTLFTPSVTESDVDRVNKLSQKIGKEGFLVQTKRICTQNKDLAALAPYDNGEFLLSVGTYTYDAALKQLHRFSKTKNVSFNIDLSAGIISTKETEILFEIIKTNPSLFFQFTYVFCNAPLTPFYPSADFSTPGFSIGLQTPDLSVGCKSLEEWLFKMKEIWDEIISVFGSEKDFLGIDSSIAPMGDSEGSFIRFVHDLGYDFSRSTTTDLYLQITKYIKSQNPRPVGLCGLMFPALEDFLLAKEYEAGNFSIERNIFLSLHSGLGVDTYPIGIDEDPVRIVQVLRLIQGLAEKYKKPLSCRFVSDGKAKIGEKTDFKNQYLKDVVIRPL